MTYKRTSASFDPVITYTSEDGFYKITKKPNENCWTLKQISLFNIMGEVIGKYNTLEEAKNA